ncbi:ABC transporter ATP-binding protein [Streptomyces lunaelactis]|nr:ABC transporter ATP-binding protein [Streptomyces lunaelactis]NUK85946.1 ABC transporter ATP-binding protein [Streptomyces lunaelactis]
MDGGADFPPDTQSAEVAESDTFEALLDAGGIFAELYKLSQDR